MKPTARWNKLKYVEEQHRLFNDTRRFTLCHTPRRAGKTEVWKRKIVKMAAHHTRSWRARIAICCPTYRQAKRIYWNDLKELTPPSCLKSKSRPNETTLSIPYWNADIEVHGLDRPERLEGTPFDFILLDEFGNMKQEAWDAHLRPALDTEFPDEDYEAGAAFIGVPEGRNHYHRKMLQLRDEDPGSIFWWKASEVLAQAKLDKAKTELSPLMFEQEYEGGWVSFAGRAYHAFDAKLCVGPAVWMKDLELRLAFDFNTSPGVCIASHYYNGKDRFFGEVYIPAGSNTRMVCDKVIANWGEHKGRVAVYGDAAGGNINSTQTLDGSDWDLIDAIVGRHFAGRYRRRVPRANPPVRGRINTFNNRLQTADGESHVVIDRSLAWLIDDLENTGTLPGSNGELDKRDKRYTHMTDAVGYQFWREYGDRVVSSSGGLN